MNTQELAEAVMELPEKDRLELARRIVAEQDTAGAIAQAVRGIEEVVTGKVRGLSEAEFRDALR
jgi:cell fate (sporulation/competence/biofilm development) regulator YlbF (YheA/YmcA/DUF963 family)